MSANLTSNAAGINTKDSPRTIEETESKLTDLIHSKGMKLLAVIDRSAEAHEVGLELRPTSLARARGDAIAFATRDGDIHSVTRLVGGRPGTIGKDLERTLGGPVTARNRNTIELIVRHQTPGS